MSDDTSRLGRNLSEVLQFCKLCQFHGVFLYFSQPALGTFGNLGLNTIRQPGLNSTQFNLSKKATLHLIGDTPATAKFESEFFSLFNHPAFNGVGITVGSATFGKITSALDPRNIAFKLKLSF